MLSRVATDDPDPPERRRRAGKIDAEEGQRKLAEYFRQPTPQEFEASVGRAIRTLRQARGWSQADLAAGVQDRGFPLQQTQVARVENGSRPLRVNEAAAFAAVLGVDLVDLLRRLARPEQSELGDLRRTVESLRRNVQNLSNEADSLGRRLRSVEEEKQRSEQDLIDLERQLDLARRAYFDAIRSGRDEEQPEHG